MSTTKKSAAKTVTVACKLPHGLILRHHVLREKDELVMGGGVRTVKEAVDTGERFVINGTAAEAGKLPMARLQSGAPGSQFAPMTDTGFALTHGVPADLWEGWLAANRNSDMVKNGLIFAHTQTASVKSQAKENEKRRTGLEPIDPANPGGGVQEADEMKKRRQGAALHV